MLPNHLKAACISEVLAALDHCVGRLMPGSYGRDELSLWFVAKIPRDVWEECWATAEGKAKDLTYEDSSALLLELALEKESDQHPNAYRSGGAISGNHGCGYQAPRLDKGLPLQMLAT